MIIPPQDYKDWLREELSRRQLRNPSYSLRSFAKQLDLPPSALSGILSGQRRVTLGIAVRIADGCQIMGAEREIFLEPLLPRSKRATQKYKETPSPTFAQIADWHHYAILGLTFLDDNSTAPEWVAERLGLSPEIAKEALRNLFSLGILEAKDGRLVQTAPPLTTTLDKPDPMVRKHNRQMLAKCIEALENSPLERRDISSMTMSINPERLPGAKLLIEGFRRELCEYLGQGPQTEVYGLTVGLVGVTVGATPPT